MEGIRTTGEGNQQNVRSNKVERKVMEKNRRNKMKLLHSELDSLLPTHHSNELPLTVSDQLDEAIKYIKSLERKLNMQKEKKESFLRRSKISSSSSSCTTPTGRQSNSRELKIKEMSSAVEVVLTTGLKDRCIFYEIIYIFQEERVEIVSVSYSVLENTIVYSLHAEIEDVLYEIGATRLKERLIRLVYELKNDAEMQAAPSSSNREETHLPANTPTTSSNRHFSEPLHLNRSQLDL